MNSDFSNLCPHGQDRRVTYCVLCEDLVKVTAAAPTLDAVVQSTVAVGGDSLKTQVGPSLNALELESLRWSPLALQLLISQYVEQEIEASAICQSEKVPILKALTARRELLESWRDELLLRRAERPAHLTAPRREPPAPPSALTDDELRDIGLSVRAVCQNCELGQLRWRGEWLQQELRNHGFEVVRLNSKKASDLSTELSRLRAENHALRQDDPRADERHGLLKEIERLEGIESRLDAAICLHLPIDPDGEGDCTDRLLAAVELAGKLLQERQR